MQGGERICSSRGARADPFLADSTEGSRKAGKHGGWSGTPRQLSLPGSQRETLNHHAFPEARTPTFQLTIGVPRGVAWPPPPRLSSRKQAGESRQRIRELRNVDPSLTLRGSRQALPLIHLCLLPCPLPTLHLALRKPRGFEQLSAQQGLGFPFPKTRDLGTAGSL